MATDCDNPTHSDEEFHALLKRDGKQVSSHPHLELYQYRNQAWACLADEGTRGGWRVMGPYALSANFVPPNPP